MKKSLVIIGLSLVMQFQANADAWTVTRNWCGGFFHKKFQAYAKVSALSYTTYSTGYNAIGQWVGTNPKGSWSSVCNNDDKGCTRPRTAVCSKSGTVYDYVYSGPYLQVTNGQPYSGYAKAYYPTGGQQITRNASGRGSAGLEGVYELDQDILDGLSEQGYSDANITGDVNMVGNELVIQNLSGFVRISDQNADYYSNLKIMVIKENAAATDFDAQAADEALAQGNFANLDVVYTSEISISKDAIEINGLFADLDADALQPMNPNDGFGYFLNNIDLTLPINAVLSVDEHLTVIMYSDGGFDISSAIISQPQGKAGLSVAKTEIKTPQVEIYPNPASGSINLKVYAQTENENVIVKAFDLMGKEVGVIYSGTLHQGAGTIQNVDVSNLPKGMHMLEVKVGDVVSYKKLTIN